MVRPSKYIIAKCASEHNNMFSKTIREWQEILCIIGGIPIFGIIPSIFQIILDILVFIPCLLLLPLALCLGPFNSSPIEIIWILMSLCFLHFFYAILNISSCGFICFYFEIVQPRLDKSHIPNNV